MKATPRIVLSRMIPPRLAPPRRRQRRMSSRIPSPISPRPGMRTASIRVLPCRPKRSALNPRIRHRYALNRCAPSEHNLSEHSLSERYLKRRISMRCPSAIGGRLLSATLSIANLSTVRLWHSRNSSDRFLSGSRRSAGSKRSSNQRRASRPDPGSATPCSGRTCKGGRCNGRTCASPLRRNNAVRIRICGRRRSRLVGVSNHHASPSRRVHRKRGLLTIFASRTSGNPISGNRRPIPRISARKVQLAIRQANPESIRSAPGPLSGPMPCRITRR